MSETEQAIGPVIRLSAYLERLPGVGPRVAERCADFIAQMTPEAAEAIAVAIETATATTTVCSVCRHLTDRTVCPICEDTERDRSAICVVEQTTDLLAIERSRSYHGQYHVLHGALSPANGITPEDIEIAPLLNRVENAAPPVSEVIMATNPTMEGDATADYLARQLLIRAPAVKVSRIARGLPTGANVSYADPTTLTSALSRRRQT